MTRRLDYWIDSGAVHVGYTLKGICPAPIYHEMEFADTATGRNSSQDHCKLD